MYKPIFLEVCRHYLFVFLISNYLLQGTVVLIFQPAEEAGNGAKRMMGDGALENVEAIFAAHVSHQHRTGVIASRSGPLLAGCGFFRAVITGKEGHAGSPHSSVDPVLAASAAVISLQGIVSREANPLDSQVCLWTTNSLFKTSTIIKISCNAILEWGGNIRMKGPRWK